MQKLSYIFIIITGFFYSTTAMFANLLQLSITLKIFYMSFFGLLSMFILVRIYKVNFIKEIKENFIILTARGLIGLVSSFTLFYAVNNMNFADATILNLTSPLWVIVFSFLLLKDKINKVQLIVLITSFVGIMFIVKPSGDFTTLVPSMSALFSGLTAGLAYTLIRGVQGKVHPFTVGFHFCFISTIILIPALFFEFDTIKNIDLISYLPLILMGSFYALAQVFMAIAYKYESASKLSIFLYFQLIFSTIYGYYLFDQSLDLYSIIGILIVLAGSIYLYVYNVYLSNVNKI